MSRENVEAVRRCYELFERRDIEGVLGLVTDDFELRLPDIYPEGPETYRGHGGLRRWVAMVQDTWGEWRFDPERLIDADEHVVALVRIVAEGGASGVPVDREVAHVWSFRGEKASTASVHLDRTQALEAVGLSGSAMSRENVEVVRRACDAWLSGDRDAVFEINHPEVEWDTTHFEGWTENKVYRGRDEVMRFLDEWLASWDSYEARVDELLEAGDRVVVFWWQRMTGRGSGVPVELDSAQVWTVRDGLVIRIDNYTDRGEALEAVGLSD
jgi:ketosteroid isomerase-like protein